MLKILLGVTGSVAACKVPKLVGLLKEAQWDVSVVMTKSAGDFVKKTDLENTLGCAVYSPFYQSDSKDKIAHIELARWADIILIAPASAHFIAKITAGLCDDLLSLLCLASTAPIFLAPAMNHVMWNHPATQNNVHILKKRGLIFLGPATGLQACGEWGIGRMLEPDIVVKDLINHQQPKILSLLRILITAGGTQEPIDPVRCITNRSTGKMGYALAQEAIRLGATVTLVTAVTAIPDPIGCCQVIHVKTAHEMLLAVESEATSHDLFVSAAAVSDYRVLNPFTHKIKRTNGSHLSLALEPNPDILSHIAQSYPLFCVAFAAETENLLDNAKKKLIDKHVDMVIVNDVSRQDIGFDRDDNEMYVVSKNSILKIDKADKRTIAEKIWQHIYLIYKATR